MSKLWEKGYTLNQTVESFMTGDDPLLDLRIAKFDCIGSIGHAQMLAKIGVLTQNEFESVKKSLEKLITIIEDGKFVIEQSDEDVHTAIEGYLTAELGDIGKKIHTARSRNDQVLTALRLYTKDQIKQILDKMIDCLNVLYEFASKYRDIPYVGRTHYQKAMPSSIGLWMGAFIESFLDDSELLITNYRLIDQCPLGSAASYGVKLPIDRQYSADVLGFSKVQNNVLYANNSRGKFESIIIHSLSQIMLDMSKLSTDVILFSAPEMKYLELPIEFCPGSSLMPNKKNPDPFELIRAKTATVLANFVQTFDACKSLPSGYNRDSQETKRPFFEACDTVRQTLEVVTIIMSKVTVNKDACINAFSGDVFATDAALHLVNQGIPFRDAYVKIASLLDELSVSDPVENILSKTHLGATGNLGLNLAKKRIEELNSFLNS